MTETTIRCINISARITALTAILTVGVTVTDGSASAAGLSLSRTFSDARLSLDGAGVGSDGGFISANVPTGSTLLGAYLYAVSTPGFDLAPISFNGTRFDSSTATVFQNPFDSAGLDPVSIARWDITTFIAPLLTGGLQNFSYSNFQDIPNFLANDGAVLAIAYRNAGTVGYTSTIYDGPLPVAPDTQSVTYNLSRPYAVGDFLVSLASSFSFLNSQNGTTIDVTTSSTPIRRLASAAGGSNDGQNRNGYLITVGGIGDDPRNPDPNATLQTGENDDELYNLALGNSVNPAPFLKTGDTSVTLGFRQASKDDNVFALFLEEAPGNGVTPPPTPTGVPEPGLGLGVLSMLGLARWLKRI